MKISISLAAAITASLIASAAFAQFKPGAGAGGIGSGIGTGIGATGSTTNVTPLPSNLAAGAAQKEADGKLAAAGWLVLLDRRDWGTAWEASAGMFRTTVPLSNWMEGIPKVREPMGRFVERSPGESIYRTTLEGRPNGEYVSVIFDTRFDKKEVQEIVTTVRDSDGKWRVTGYSVR